MMSGFAATQIAIRAVQETIPARRAGHPLPEFDHDNEYPDRGYYESVTLSAVKSHSVMGT